MLRLAIEAAGGLIEHQDDGVADQGTGDGDALALAARQAPSGFADIGGVTVGQVDDEVMDAGGGRGLDDLFIGGAWHPVGDVVAHRACEQHAILGYVADPGCHG